MQRLDHSATQANLADQPATDNRPARPYQTLQRMGWPNWVPLNTDVPVTLRVAMGTTSSSRPRGKYRPLYDYLAVIGLTDVTLRLADFPAKVGLTLPPTAFKHQAFWSNQQTLATRPWTTAWHAAGFRVDKVQLDGREGWVRFRRRG